MHLPITFSVSGVAPGNRSQLAEKKTFPEYCSRRPFHLGVGRVD